MDHDNNIMTPIWMSHHQEKVCTSHTVCYEYFFQGVCKVLKMRQYILWNLSSSWAMHDYIHLPFLKPVNMYAVGLSISELSLCTSQKKTLNILQTFYFCVCLPTQGGANSRAWTRNWWYNNGTMVHLAPSACEVGDFCHKWCLLKVCSCTFWTT